MFRHITVLVTWNDKHKTHLYQSINCTYRTIFHDFEETSDLDQGTLSLICELEKKQKRQNISMGVAGILIASGTIMAFLPLNLDDIEASPEQN